MGFREASQKDQIWLHLLLATVLMVDQAQSSVLFYPEIPRREDQELCQFETRGKVMRYV
jgi:hypothetical protein